MPLKSFGEKTSNGSEMTYATSQMPFLQRQHGDIQAAAMLRAFGRRKQTHSFVSKRVNLRRKTPGTRTESLAKMQSEAGCPSMPLSFSGV